jgi:hypothetical protein
LFCHLGERWVHTWLRVELCLELGLGVHVRVRRQRTAIDDHLLADPAPARIGGRIVQTGRLAVYNVARAEIGKKLRRLRVIGFIGFFHGVEVVEDAVELVEAMHRGQVFIPVTKVVLADLRRCISVRLEQFGDRRILVLQALLCSWHPHFQQAGAERGLSQDERCPPGRAGLLSVVVGEKCALFGDAIDIGRASAHHAAMVGADIPDAHIVAHDDDNVWTLLRRWRLRSGRLGQGDRHQRRRPH